VTFFEVRVRFAPSPTGPLHVGGARTALFNWLFARKHDGTFVLRIEDTDLKRCRREWEALIFEDLRWLGLDWDEGPDVGGPFGPYRQSERLDLYRDHAERLLAKRLVYRCFCTEEDLEKERKEALSGGKAPRYSGRCRKLGEGEVLSLLQQGRSYALRFHVEPRRIAVRDLIRGDVAFNAEDIGDFIIMKFDGWPTYNFAAVVDDNLMRISHIIRGEDHLPNTPRQILLYNALGFKPPQFAHLPLIIGPDQIPLSKRHGVSSISEFKEVGYLSEALVNFLALLGWSPGGEEELFSKDELIERFDLSRVNRAPAIFDCKKLDWMSSRYLRMADLERLVELTIPYLRRAGLIDEAYNQGHVALAIKAVRDSVSKLSELAQATEVLLRFDPEAALRDPEVTTVLRAPEARKALEALREELKQREALTAELYPTLVKALEQQTGLHGRVLFRPIRAALTGAMSGPELRLLLSILGKEECLRRLEAVLKGGEEENLWRRS